VWNLTKVLSTCGECSRGCAITVEVLRGREVKRVRPRYDPEVNDWWMCDHGRFAFGRFNEPGRLGGGARRGSSGLETCDAERALDETADLLRVHARPAIVASPWLTQEEGALVLRLARSLGVGAAFLAPPASPLADDLLHTGDPCPNRRGLVELGFEALEAEVALARIAQSESALLVGERSALLAGAERLAAIPARARLALFDTLPLDVPAAQVLIGVPNAAERSGTWINVDGVRRSIAPARSAPQGVAPLTRTLEGLLARLATAGIGRG
jgi:NADH-quinone oxidoreductase subunit G